MKRGWLLAGLLLATGVQADGGKLLATGGASSLEGAAGGGITPWAVIGGYGESGQAGATAFATRVWTGDYRLDATGWRRPTTIGWRSPMPASAWTCRPCGG